MGFEMFISGLLGGRGYRGDYGFGSYGSAMDFGGGFPIFGGGYNMPFGGNYMGGIFGGRGRRDSYSGFDFSMGGPGYSMNMGGFGGGQTMGWLGLGLGLLGALTGGGRREGHRCNHHREEYYGDSGYDSSYGDYDGLPDFVSARNFPKSSRSNGSDSPEYSTEDSDGETQTRTDNQGNKITVDKDNKVTKVVDPTGVVVRQATNDPNHPYDVFSSLQGTPHMDGENVTLNEQGRKEKTFTLGDKNVKQYVEKGQLVTEITDKDGKVSTSSEPFNGTQETPQTAKALQPLAAVDAKNKAEGKKPEDTKAPKDTGFRGRGSDGMMQVDAKDIDGKAHKAIFTTAEYEQYVRLQARINFWKQHTSVAQFGGEHFWHNDYQINKAKEALDALIQHGTSQQTRLVKEQHRQFPDASKVTILDKQNGKDLAFTIDEFSQYVSLDEDNRLDNGSDTPDENGDKGGYSWYTHRWMRDTFDENQDEVGMKKLERQAGYHYSEQADKINKKGK